MPPHTPISQTILATINNNPSDALLSAHHDRQAKEVSSKRKEIKELREQLMSEVGSLGAEDVPQDMLASLGLGQKKLTAAEKVRATKAENGVSMDAILDLERENRELRCAPGTTARHRCSPLLSISHPSFSFHLLL